MTIKEKQKRDIRIFEMKFGLNGNEEHTYEEISRKFNLSKAQVVRNVQKVGFHITGLIVANGYPASGSDYSQEEFEKIYTTYIAAYQKQYEDQRAN